MLAKTLTCAVVGLEGALVEVDIGPGLPAFNIVGLPDAAVQEAKERVRAAVKNSGADSLSAGSLSTSRPQIRRRKVPFVKQVRQPRREAKQGARVMVRHQCCVFPQRRINISLALSDLKTCIGVDPFVRQVR
jgi:hypothetical protein